MTIKHGNNNNRCLICYKLLQTWKGKLCNSYDIRKKSNLNKRFIQYCLPISTILTPLCSPKQFTKHSDINVTKSLTSSLLSSSASSSSSSSSSSVSSTTSAFKFDINDINHYESTTTTTRVNVSNTNTTATTNNSTAASNKKSNSNMTIIDLINKTINNVNNLNLNLTNTNRICENCYKNLLLIYYFMSQTNKYRNIVKKKLTKSLKLTSKFKSNYNLKTAAVAITKNNKNQIKLTTMIKEANSTNNNSCHTNENKSNTNTNKKKIEINNLIHLKNGNKQYVKKNKTVNDLLVNCDKQLVANNNNNNNSVLNASIDSEIVNNSNNKNSSKVFLNNVNNLKLSDSCNSKSDDQNNVSSSRRKRKSKVSYLKSFSL